MTKTWKTKKKIIKLISNGTKTSGEISKELGLAPSTVSEHLDELERMGAVSKVDNPYVKKWKYYRSNPKFNVNNMGSEKMTNRLPQIAATLAVIVGLIAILTIGISALSGGNQIAFRLTDPPKVPNGTTALLVVYSSLQAHIAGNGNESGWISGNGSGTLNLMTLINTSQVIGTGKIPANATIDMVRLTINSAQIIINGTTYNVTVPNGLLTARVTEGNVNANSSILIDISPVVATIYTENATVFVLVPSVKAIVIGNAKVPLRTGTRANLSTNEQNRLSRATPSISITSANLTVAGNSTTSLSVTVKNNANQNVVIRHLVLYGTPTVFVSDNDMHSIWDGMPLGVNIEDRPGFMQPGPTLGSDTDTSGSGPEHGMIAVNGMGVINGVHVRIIGNNKTGMNVSPMMNDLVRIGEKATLFGTLNFIVTANGTLVLPFMGEQPTPMAYNGSGYAIQAGASATFTFSGQILFANGHMRMTPVAGETFKVLVVGEEGAMAQVNVTASSG